MADGGGPENGLKPRKRWSATSASTRSAGLTKK
jgi:hypothetical protein